MPTLQWIGKEKIINHHLDVPYRVLDHHYGFAGQEAQQAETGSGNKIIHGDMPGITNPAKQNVFL